MFLSMLITPSWKMIGRGPPRYTRHRNRDRRTSSDLCPVPLCGLAFLHGSRRSNTSVRRSQRDEEHDHQFQPTLAVHLTAPQEIRTCWSPPRVFRGSVTGNALDVRGRWEPQRLRSRNGTGEPYGSRRRCGDKPRGAGVTTRHLPPAAIALSARPPRTIAKRRRFPSMQPPQPYLPLETGGRRLRRPHRKFEHAPS
jgi:hypothetical protein